MRRAYFILTVVLLLTLGNSAFPSEPIDFVNIMSAQLDFIHSIDVKYIIMNTPPEVSIDYFNSYQYKDIIDLMKNLENPESPLNQCKFIQTYQNIREGEKEYIYNESYDLTEYPKITYTNSKYWNDPDSELCNLYYPYSNHVELGTSASSRVVFKTYEQFIKYGLLGTNDGRVLKEKYSDGMKVQIVRFEENTDMVILESIYQPSINEINGCAELVKPIDESQGMTLISHLSKEKGYLPVYYKRTQNFAPTGFETFIQYELSNKGVYFPLRIKKKITNKKLSNNVTFLANFSELKINEDIPDDTFDLYKTIPIGCWIHDNIKGITYVYGKPEEGIK